MKLRYFLVSLLTLQSFVSGSDLEDLRRSQLIRKKKKIEARIRALRDKIDLQEADSAEPAKFYQLLEEEKKIKEKIKNFSHR